MKCPFCQQEIMCMDAQDADEHSTWYCPRCIAERAWYAFGNETLWQELIRTRKALDKAINVLNRVKDVKYEEYIDEKLEQINEIIKGGNNE